MRRHPHLLKFHQAHLAYCTNIHPAETWEETFRVLQTHVLAVRDLLRQRGDLGADDPFAIGLRLSALAASELLEGNHLATFKEWLQETNTYVFTINGFPYGNFHGTRVKEKVFQPDWTEPARLVYTMNLFRILAVIAKPETGASVSTLPGSHKSFAADESLIRENLIALAQWLDKLAEETGIDFHLGLEPEPFGHFEDTPETIAFFERLHADAPDSAIIRRRIGVNFDTCHFALQFEDIGPSLDLMREHGIRISKIHLSSALEFDPSDPKAVEMIRSFDEPTYFHQVVILMQDEVEDFRRYQDLPDFLNAGEVPGTVEARVHFHIPLYAEPDLPLCSTQEDAMAALDWFRENPTACPHFEIETYTWAVMPETMRRKVEKQIAAEYRWVLRQT